MGRQKRKAVPVVPVIKSRKRARQVVTQFHQLDEKLAALARGKKDDERKGVEEAIAKLGGRAAYQAASNLSVSYFNTSKWVLKQLREMKVKPTTSEGRLMVLEVGAINTFLSDCTWLQVEAIDLKSSHERIRQVDFFDLPASPPRYDVIVSSMVINSVPEPERRGLMLKRMSALLVPSGHLFLMLPLSCLVNSPHIDLHGFRSILSEVGLTVIKEHSTPKVAFFVCRRGDGSCDDGSRKPSKPRKPAKSSGGKRWVKDFNVII